MKRCFTVYCALLLCLSLSACGVLLSDNLSKEQIFSLVARHEEELRACIASGQYDAATAIDGIQDVYKYGRYGCVVFYCGGAGFGSATSYYGFYYSPADRPLSVEAAPEEAALGAVNGFEWHEENGDNSYRTERITENFFYYESHY